MALGNGSNDIDIRVRVDANGAITVLNRVGEELKKVETNTTQASSGVDKFEKRLDGLELLTEIYY